MNTRQFLAGSFAGLTYTHIAFVFDLLKVRAQHESRKEIKYREEIKRIYRNEGLKGFFRGYQGMFVRDVPGFATYFMTYEFIKRNLGVSDDITRDD